MTWIFTLKNNWCHFKLRLESVRPRFTFVSLKKKKQEEIGVTSSQDKVKPRLRKVCDPINF